VDYICLSESRFAFQDADISFDGTTGLIQIHNNSLTLTLGSTGRIAARSQELKSDRASFKRWDLK
jgi:hypothetical protein